ncbi:MAG: Hsp33 family molecular chaperone HslO [Deltaproteobacteria bacterium]|nr:Hsp33 family molecular chaperone HslO [Deltaproteobacteria bacterium]
MNINMHLAHYYRYHWERADLIVVTGDAAQIWKGFTAYCRRYKIPVPEAEKKTMLFRMFAAAGLAAVSLPEAEYWGWSVTFSGLNTGIFCGVEPNGMMCGTLLKSNPERNLVAVQRQAINAPATQSRFSLFTHDPVEAVEHYFAESEQTLIRIAVDDTGKGVLLRPLPGGRFDEIEGLTDSELISRCYGMANKGKITLLHEMLFFYECPCSIQIIDKMIKSLPEDQQKTLWRDLDHLEVLCPRCSRKYLINR